jgi:hypothetical protein
MRRRLPRRAPRPKSAWRGDRNASPISPISPVAPAVRRRPWTPNPLQLVVVHLSVHGKALSFFVSSLAAAYLFGWNNTDLVWSFWTASFIVGNVALLRGLASPLLFIKKKATAADWQQLGQAGVVKQIGMFVVAIVLLCGHLAFSAFMVLHFSVFNFGQAWVLQALFPHPGLAAAMEGDLAPGALEVARILLGSYWFIVLQKLLFDRMAPDTADGEADPDIGEWVKRPYLQVARMQLLIFAVVGLNALDAPQFLVYVIIFTIFFFPLEVFRRSQPQVATSG